MKLVHTPGIRSAALAMTIGLGLSAAQAQNANPAPHHQGRGAQAFAQLDANKDGFIDRNEAAQRKRMAQMFDQIDTDKDQRLSPSELRAARAAHGHRRGGAASPGTPDSAQ